MAELYYPTTLKERGPWLIETSSLIALDELVEQLIAPGASDAEQNSHSIKMIKKASEPNRSLAVYLPKDRELRTSLQGSNVSLRIAG